MKDDITLISLRKVTMLKRKQSSIYSIKRGGRIAILKEMCGDSLALLKIVASTGLVAIFARPLLAAACCMNSAGIGKLWPST